MSKEDLGGPILKSVSRSFYLSVRVLPAQLRSPIGLAYLLARASDTIADTSSIPVGSRITHLAAYGRMVEGGTRANLKQLQEDIRPPHLGEQRLIARLGECLDWLESLPAADAAEIRGVLSKIIRGQTLDLQRFPQTDSGAGSVKAIQTAKELEEYTYLVAGCVGEFWTRISFLHLPRYSEMDPTELARIGRDFGKGLQLVNILRDMPSDLREGRCYLPAVELQAAGIDVARLATEPSLAQPIFDSWIDRADSLVEAGARYIRAIRPAQVRIACYLPWDIAVKTLTLMRRNPPLTNRTRVKIPRGSVYGSLGKALIVSVSSWPVR